MPSTGPSGSLCLQRYVTRNELQNSRTPERQYSSTPFDLPADDMLTWYDQWNLAQFVVCMVPSTKPLATLTLDVRREKLNRHRQKRGRVVLARNLLHGLQEPELESDRLLRNHRRRLHELFRRLKFSLCINDFGAPLSFGLGLTGHSPLHAIW